MLVVSGQAIHRPTYAYAYQAGVPGELLLALVQAESRRQSDAERWYTYDVNYIKSLINAGEWNILQNIVNNITFVHDSDDISFGCTQQTPRWSEEYGLNFGTDTSHRNDLEFILTLRDKYFDPHYALRVAAKKVKGLLARPDVNGNEIMALYKYNRSAVGVMPPPANEANYNLALKQARDWFRQDVEDALANMTNNAHSFNFGIGDKADELANAGIDVGPPLGDEEKVTEHTTIQVAGRGVFVYHDSGHTLFVPAF